MWTPYFLVCKKFGFFKFMVCPHGQASRGLSQCGHFADKGEGVNFSRFCADGLLFVESICNSNKKHNGAM